VSAGRRLWTEALLGGVSLALCVLSLAWPEWIEEIFGVDPDAGSGATEWLATVGFAVAAVALSLLARRDWRRARVAPPVARDQAPR
jgi:Na+-driven multidrug efflux pump